MTRGIALNDMIFVYGTLMTGERADLSRDRRVSFIRNDEINGDIHNIGSFPGAVVPHIGHFDPGHHAIKGELYVVRNPVIGPFLDGYEGYPSLYNRVEVETSSGNIAWVYTFNPPIDNYPVIPSGDWRHREVKIVRPSVVKSIQTQTSRAA